MKLIVVVGVALLLFGWAVYAFNRLVRGRNLVREGWSGIDVQLKRRHDLVPNLVETVRAYAHFEKDLMTEVARLRAGGIARGASTERQDGENALATELRGVLALAEDYPELRASRSFLRLQEQLAEIEDHLQMARRYYNGAVRDYNIAVESFPSNAIASFFRFPLEQYFQVESATERRVPEVRL